MSTNAIHQKTLAMADAIETTLTAVGRGMTSMELREHPAMQATYTSPKGLGQTLALMKRQGRVKKQGNGTKYARWNVVSHKDAKLATAEKAAASSKAIKLEFSKSNRAVAFELEGLRFEISVVA